MYDYICEKCDISYEIHVPLAKFDEAIECPKCKEGLKRQISAPHLR